MNKSYILKINKILSFDQKKNFFFFFFLSLISMMLEMLGIGLIIPFLTIFTQDISVIQEYKILNNFNIIQFSKVELISYSVFILIILYSIKASFLTYVSYKEVKFISKIRIELTESLFTKYINKPYEYFLNINSAQLIRNINDVTVFVNLIKSLLLLLTEIVVLIGVAAVVILYEPVAAILTIILLSILGILFQSLIHQKAKKWGEERRDADGFRLKQMQESFRSIKDIKILNKENFFIKIFSDFNKISANTQLKQSFFISLPRLWLEVIAIIGFSFLVLFLIKENEDPVKLITTLGLFAAATFRLLPSVTRVMNSFQNIQFSAVVTDSLFKELREKKDNNNFIKSRLAIDNHKNKINFSEKIELKNISFKYDKTEKFILRNINFIIQKGSAIGIKGESGVGKTTLINILLGLLQPSEGNILIDGNKINQSSIKEWQKNIGYVPQSIFLSDDSLRKNIAFGLSDDLIDEEKVKNSIMEAKLDEFIKSTHDGLDTKIGELGSRLSGGQIQRIGIARSLYNNPDLIILDEFTSSLDRETENKVINEINDIKGKKTVVMISHKESTLLKCDTVFKLKDNELVKL